MLNGMLRGDNGIVLLIGELVALTV